MEPKKKVWGLAKPEQYSVKINGEFYGPGLNPEAQIPGFFNLLQLLSSDLDNMLGWRGDPMQYPIRLGGGAYAAATALQLDAQAPQYTLGDLAEILDPEEFVERIRGRTDLIIYKCFGDCIWGLLADRAAVLKATAEARNVVRVDFKNKFKLG
jgi:hypothetical protein